MIRNMDIYHTNSANTNKSVSEKTFEEHRRLYFHEGKWLFTSEGLELETRHCRSDSDDSSVLSVSLPRGVTTIEATEASASSLFCLTIITYNYSDPYRTVILTVFMH